MCRYENSPHCTRRCVSIFPGRLYNIHSISNRWRRPGWESPFVAFSTNKYPHANTHQWGDAVRGPCPTQYPSTFDGGTSGREEERTEDRLIFLDAIAARNRVWPPTSGAVTSRDLQLRISMAGERDAHRRLWHGRTGGRGTCSGFYYVITVTSCGWGIRTTT